MVFIYGNIILLRPIIQYLFAGHGSPKENTGAAYAVSATPMCTPISVV